MKWLKEPHVAEFWQETENEEAFRQKFLHKLRERGVLVPSEARYRFEKARLLMRKIQTDDENCRFFLSFQAPAVIQLHETMCLTKEFDDGFDYVREQFNVDRPLRHQEFLNLHS